MDLNQLANVGEFLGGIAVLVTLIYLAVQVSGSKQALKAQAHHDALALCQRPFELLIADAALADTIDRGHESPETLSSAEWQQYSHYLFVLFNGWEYLYYLNKADSVPPELWRGGNAYFGNLAATKAGCRRFWDETQHGYDEPFHSHAAGYLQTGAESIDG